MGSHTSTGFSTSADECALARNRELMGEHRNRGAFDGLAAVTVFVTSTLSLTLVAVTLLGLV